MFGGSSSIEYDEIVAKTTDENLTSENWELVMNLCDKVGDEGQAGAHAAIVAILKRLTHRNPNVQLYALSLSESLGKNLGIDIHREIASRAFTQGLEKLITDRNTHEKVRNRALGLIAEWASEFENDESLGIMEDCYTGLKAKNYKFEQPNEPPPPTVDDEIRRREEAELEHVLEMSKQDLGRARWTEYSLASSTSAGSSGSGDVGRSSSASPGTQPNSPPTGHSARKYQGGYVPARTPSPDRVAAEQRQRQLEYQKQLQAQQLQQSKEHQAREHQAKEQVATVTPSSIPVISTPVDTSAAATSASRTPKINIVTRARALYTFEPTEPGELGFEKGDIIKVVDRGYKDWWRGQLKGRTGIFPVNYVEPMPEPTAAELGKEAEQEAAVFAQAVNVEKLLNMLRAFDPSKDNLADNEEIQELYRSSMALRPKIVKLIDKYSQKRADLVSMNEAFLRARTSFDTMMEESLAKHTGIYDQPTFRPTRQYGSSVPVGGPQPFGWGPGYDQQIPLQQPPPQPGYGGYPGPGGPVPVQPLPSTTPVPAQHPTTVYGSIPLQGPALQQGPIPQQSQPQGQAQSQGLPAYGIGHQVTPPYSQQGPTPYPVQQQRPQESQQQPQSQHLYQQPQSQPASYQQPAQAEQQHPVQQLYQHSSQPIQPQAQPQPQADAITQPYQSQTQHQPQLVASIVSPQTQPEPLPQPEVQSQAQPQSIPHQLEPELQPQPHPEPQPKPAQPIAGPPPYPYDPSYTYADPNVQAWARYYAQGGTDATGSVYFISIPGVKEETPTFVVAGQQQASYDLSRERPEERAATQSVSYIPAEGQPQIQPSVTHDQSFRARPASGGGDTPIGDTGAVPALTVSNMPRYQLSDGPVL